MDLDELERIARDRMERGAYDYYAGGADDERTLADNVAAWGRLRLRPRVLRDVARVETATTVLGTPVAMPILVAPTAAHRLACDEGEAATARAAEAAQTLMVVSTLGTRPLEEVAAAAPAAPRWFQLYIRTDRGFARDLAARAEAAGYRALVLTVDMPAFGDRRRDRRNAFAMPPGLDMANFRGRATDAAGWLGAAQRDDLDASLTFDDLAALCASTKLPVLVKGLVRDDDARAAVDAGAAAIVVSNHGGRQLDTTVATADALPEIVAAVGDAVEIYVDGGIRRGTDVLKAVALGARAVLVGRPVLWGLAARGEAGARDVLEGLHRELRLAMALAGAARLEDVTPDLVLR